MEGKSSEQYEGWQGWVDEGEMGGNMKKGGKRG
jgi:hypothetical protein